jgi:hypothetical protein
MHTLGKEALIKRVAAHKVGNRPNRYESRRIKRRRKSHDLQRKPRPEYKRLVA